MMDGQKKMRLIRDHTHDGDHDSDISTNPECFILNRFIDEIHHAHI